jgi:hypothetical protein
MAPKLDTFANMFAELALQALQEKMGSITHRVYASIPGTVGDLVEDVDGVKILVDRIKEFTFELFDDTAFIDSSYIEHAVTSVVGQIEAELSSTTTLDAVILVVVMSYDPSMFMNRVTVSALYGTKVRPTLPQLMS